MRSLERKIVYLGLATAVAMVLSYLELLLPPVFAAVPGVKMGLPNIVILYILYCFGTKYAVAVSIIRVLAVSMLFGNVMTLIYSLAGATLSLIVMCILIRPDFFSPVGVSVAGGVFHNLGQILMAMLLLETAAIGYYMIVLAVTGTIAGIFVGLCGSFLIQRM